MSLPEDASPIIRASEEQIEDEEREVEEVEEQVTGFCLSSFLCNPRKTGHRFFALLFLCLMSFGSYFCYDNPAALETQIKDDMKVDIFNYSLLYSLYSWPNVILSLIGGFLVDRWLGIRLGSIIFSGFILLGQAIFAFGALWNSFFMMEVGRFTFGLGGENLAVCQNAYAVKWFLGRELNMVFGLLISVSRLGSSANLWIMPPVYDAFSAGGLGVGHAALGWTLLIGAFFCIFSLYCTAQMAIFDKRADRILKRKNDVKAGDEVKLSDVLHLPLSLWLLCVVCVGYYCAVMPFVGQAQLFFRSKWGLSASGANAASSLVYILSAICSPLAGVVLDRMGRNLTWMIFATLLAIVAFLALAFTPLTPFVAMVLIGISFSFLAASFWPIIAYVVPESRLGTAYGLIQSVQNLGLAAFSMASGAIVDQKGFLVLIIFFTASLCVGVLAMVVLVVVDIVKHEGLLNASPKQRELILAKLEAKAKREGIKEE